MGRLSIENSDYEISLQELVDMFDCMDKVAICGNRDFNKYVPSFYDDAKDMIEEIQDYYYDDNLKEYDNKFNLSKDQLESIGKYYDKDNMEDVVKVLNMAHPDSDYQIDTMRGYTQGDWQNIIYDSNNVDSKKINTIEAYYFGKTKDLVYTNDEEETIVTTLTDDEFYNINSYEQLQEYVNKEFEEDDHLRVFDNYYEKEEITPNYSEFSVDLYKNDEIIKHLDTFDTLKLANDYIDKEKDIYNDKLSLKVVQKNYVKDKKDYKLESQMTIGEGLDVIDITTNKDNKIKQIVKE